VEYSWSDAGDGAPRSARSRSSRTAARGAARCRACGRSRARRVRASPGTMRRAIDLDGLGGFQQIHLHGVLFLSTPSARYTDKADGPRRVGCRLGFAPAGEAAAEVAPARRLVSFSASTTRRSALSVDVGADVVAVRRLLEDAFHLGVLST
jgi:hypothetical protein